MAQALPSFVELLASLDLESDENSEVQHYAHYPTSPSFVTSSPSSSLPSLPSSQLASPGRFLTSPGSATSLTSSSPSIVISHPSPVDDSVSSRRRSTSNRYSPYVSPNVFSRRSSLPGDLTGCSDHARQDSASSRASSAFPPTRRASLGNLAYDSSAHLTATRMTMSKTDQPISALVRRRHPHSSPQSPDLPKTVRRSVSPTDRDSLTPVSLPSLPPLPPISAGTDCSVLSFPESSRLPPISTFDHGSTVTSLPERLKCPHRTT